MFPPYLSNLDLSKPAVLNFGLRRNTVVPLLAFALISFRNATNRYAVHVKHHRRRCRYTSVVYELGELPQYVQGDAHAGGWMGSSARFVYLYVFYAFSLQISMTCFFTKHLVFPGSRMRPARPATTAAAWRFQFKCFLIRSRSRAT